MIGRIEMFSPADIEFLISEDKIVAVDVWDDLSCISRHDRSSGM